jgi:hypothetical protein
MQKTLFFSFRGQTPPISDPLENGFLAPLEARKFTLPDGGKPPFLHLKGTEFTLFATHMFNGQMYSMNTKH